MGLEITIVVVGALACNCIIVSDDASKEAIVLDPGADAATINDRIAACLGGVTVVGVYHTHAHFDHCLASNRVRGDRGLVHLHGGDRPLWDALGRQAAMIGVAVDEGEFEDGDAPRPPDVILEGGENVMLGGRSIGKALHTPRHSPGSIAIHLPELKTVCTGDTLFRDSVGRTDLWGASFDSLADSIRTRLYTLPKDTIVIPGHGPKTTIGREMASNVFVNGMGDGESSTTADAAASLMDYDDEFGEIDVIVDDVEAFGTSAATPSRPSRCRCCAALKDFEVIAKL